MPIHPSRRSAIATAAAGVAAATLARPSSARAADAERPNIIFYASEDNNPIVGAYGDKIAHTPNIDRLAREGVMFRNGYSTAPVCAPSRYSLVTGDYAQANAPANQMRANAHFPAAWKSMPQLMREAGYYTTNNSKTDYNCDLDPKKIWDDSSDKAHWRNRPAGKPFFSMFTNMETHESRLYEPPLAGKVKPADVRIPADLPDIPEIRVELASMYNHLEAMDTAFGKLLSDLQADGLADDTVVVYFGDNGGVLPAAKRHCNERGLRVPIIVYFPPKWRHLAPGKPGSVIDAPVTLMDLAPSGLALAGVSKPANMHSSVLFGKGAKLPAYAFGMRGRMDERFDFVRTVTDGRWRYVRNYNPHLPSGQYMASAWETKGYQAWEALHLAGKLTPVQDRFFLPRPYEELYNVAVDPDETKNLIDDPAAGAHLTRLRRALDAQMLEINDNGFIPEGSTLQGAEASRAPGAYPLPRLMALAAVACARSPANVGRLRGALADSNEIVRYWAALGLAMLKQGATPARLDLAARLNTEASIPVKIAVAQALAYAGDPAPAVAYLASVLDSDAPQVFRLLAINGLDYIGEPSRAAMATLDRGVDDKNAYVQRSIRYLRLVLRGEYKPDAVIRSGFGAPL